MIKTLKVCKRMSLFLRDALEVFRGEVHDDPTFKEYRFRGNICVCVCVSVCVGVCVCEYI